ncbi:hypothetical protein [Flexivirga sp. B27]
MIDRWKPEHDDRLAALEGVKRPTPEHRGQLAALRMMARPMTSRGRRVAALAARWANGSERSR